MLINRGTLHPGDVVVAGTSYGKVRALIDPRGSHVDAAKPADPVEILGLNSVPTAGDEFRVFEDERDARRLAEERALRARLAKQEARSHMSLDDLFSVRLLILILLLRLMFRALSRLCVMPSRRWISPKLRLISFMLL